MIRRALLDFLLSCAQTDEIHGIRVADFGKPEHEFTRHMRAALELIREIDSRRFQRVQRLRWIANKSVSYGVGWGEYLHISRACAIDFEPHEGATDEILACMHASLIVHEATHCLLAERGCKYEGKVRERHERICVREENRFCRRLEAVRPGSAEWMIREFDSSKWNKAWEMSKFDRLKAAWQRMEERQAT